MSKFCIQSKSPRIEVLNTFPTSAKWLLKYRNLLFELVVAMSWCSITKM
ncbi:hypothetical protein [Fusobacterium necrophorum]|nr:hypothetical protein [Fusobacterium necrophorum]